MMRATVLMVLSMVMVSVTASEVDADAYIQYREGLMENARNHTKGIASILKGKVKAKENLIRHARALHEVSMMIPSGFPEGSDFGETSAKEKIWEDWDGFSAAAKKHQMAAAGLIKAVESGDMAAVGDVLGEVGKSCKGCHKAYREKK